MVDRASVDAGKTLLDRLNDEHRKIEARLEELGRHIGLTSAEKLEYSELKKRKLAMKDQMRRLART